MDGRNSTVLCVNFNVWHVIIITKSRFVIIRVTSFEHIVVLIGARIYLITMLFIFVHVHFKFSLLAHAVDSRLWRNLLKLLSTCTLSHVAISSIRRFQIFFLNFFNDIGHLVLFFFDTGHFEQRSAIVFELIITWTKLCSIHLWSLESHI